VPTVALSNPEPIVAARPADHGATTPTAESAGPATPPVDVPVAAAQAPRPDATPAGRTTPAPEPSPAPAALASARARATVRRATPARSSVDPAETPPRTSVAVHGTAAAHAEPGAAGATTVMDLGPTNRMYGDRSAGHTVRHVPLRARPQTPPASGTGLGPVWSAPSSPPVGSSASRVDAAAGNRAVGAFAPAAAPMAAMAPAAPPPAPVITAAPAAVATLARSPAPRPAPPPRPAAPAPAGALTAAMALAMWPKPGTVSRPTLARAQVAEEAPAPEPELVQIPETQNGKPPQMPEPPPAPAPDLDAIADHVLERLRQELRDGRERLGFLLDDIR
jgi:hypothetical protein